MRGWTPEESDGLFCAALRGMYLKSMCSGNVRNKYTPPLRCAKRRRERRWWVPLPGPSERPESSALVMGGSYSVRLTCGRAMGGGACEL